MAPTLKTLVNLETYEQKMLELGIERGSLESDERFQNIQGPNPSITNEPAYLAPPSKRRMAYKRRMKA